MLKKIKGKINTARAIVSFLRKKIILKSFPNIINIEINNNCQLKCSMCPMNTGIVKRKKSYLSKEQFDKILKKYSKYLYHVCLSHHGEPLLHPDLIYFIKTLKKKNIGVSITTNAFHLTKDISQGLINSGLDEITISFDTLDKIKYEKIRNNSNYNLVYNNIKSFLKLNKGRIKTTIRTVELDLLSEKDFVLLSKEFKGKNIFVSREKFNTWGGRINPKNFYKAFKNNLNFKCLQPWTNAIINSDGNLFICNNQEDEHFGNILKEDLITLWNSEKMVNLRKDILLGNKSNVKLCRECAYDETPKLFQNRIGKNPYLTLVKYLFKRK